MNAKSSFYHDIGGLRYIYSHLFCAEVFDVSISGSHATILSRQCYALIVLLLLLALSARPLSGVACPGVIHAFCAFLTPCLYSTLEHKISQLRLERADIAAASVSKCSKRRSSRL